MNVSDLLKLAHDANTSAEVTIYSMAGKKERSEQRRSAFCVQWQWMLKDQVAMNKVYVSADMADEDRWPHFAIRSYLQMAAEKMAERGGTPNRKSPLFMPATEVLDYQRQKDLLDMKLASGVISLQCYVDSLVVLLTRRHKDNALWYGANKDG